MIAQNYKPKINPRNKDFVSRINSFADKYSIIGIVDVEGLPAPQFQRIRASVKKKGAEVLIVKKNLIELVLVDLEKKYKGIGALVEKANGVVGLIFTNENPFTLYKTVKKNKSSAPAKPGQIAPTDIIVPAGPTSFAPGPIIGELGALGIKAGIAAGKVEIKSDSRVAKEGEVISSALAGVLSRLGIEPMEVGLNIKAIYEGGVIYGRDILNVDEEAILADIVNEASRCTALAYGLKYVTPENVQLFISEAARDSLGLGVGVAYPAAETIKQLVTKANAQGNGVAMSLPEDVRPAGVSVATPVAEVSANEESQTEGNKEEVKEVDASANFGGFF